MQRGQKMTWGDQGGFDIRPDQRGRHGFAALSPFCPPELDDMMIDLLRVEVTISGNRVSGYDYTNACHFDGNLPSLYHYGQGAH